MIGLMPSSKEELKDWLRENLRIVVRIQPSIGENTDSLFVGLKFSDEDQMIDWRIVGLAPMKEPTK